jgi:hypothetical protein
MRSFRIALQQRWAVRVAAGQRPAAVVDSRLVDPSVRFAVGDDHERKIHWAGLTVEVQNHLFKAASLEDDVLNVLDRGVALREPLPRVGEEHLERLRALMRPRTGSYTSGSPANDSSSASGSPESRPSK